MFVQIIDNKNGAYRVEHTEIMREDKPGNPNNNRRIGLEVVDHDQNYFRTINCNIIFLIHKKDCRILRQ